MMSNSGKATGCPSPNTTDNPVKKKRNLPGNPDPDAEVIALSPKTLMATNRFMCEICSKGFQRDQNLQLHRRGHNLPWKLKQRAKADVVRKKVYICPESSCVHHSPSRALGDLTGVKKHFSRKHGEKKYKCEKCSKKYAVQCDWKAHSKTCGTREYRCDCGTIFSRRDSFITHRAFCDALAEESARANIIRPPNPISIENIASINTNSSHNIDNPHPLLFSLAEQQQTPLTSPLPMISSLMRNSSAADCNTSNDDEQLVFSILKREQQHFNMRVPILATDEWPPSSSSLLPPLPSSAYNSSPHLSATALLQKAAEMGATMSSRPQHTQMAAATTSTSTSTSTSGFVSTTTTPSPLLQEIMLMNMSAGLDGHGSFNNNNNNRSMDEMKTSSDQGLTRDFLGLKALSHKDIFSMGMASAAGLDHFDHPCMSMSMRPPSFENE